MEYASDKVATISAAQPDFADAPSRADPKPGDAFYLHVSDLLLALQRHQTHAAVRVLDFGCGGSPYRALFPNAEYFRADLATVPNTNFVIDDKAQTSAPPGFFDIVLSTQVLEHCPSPSDYLHECHRVLKQTGRLLLTTHGLFEDHHCPGDFFRWTEDGLRLILHECGFQVTSLTRLTMGPRAGLMLLQRSIAAVTMKDRAWPIRALWWPFRRFLLLRRIFWDPLLNVLFPEYRVSNSQRVPGDNLYIALFAVAEPR